MKQPVQQTNTADGKRELLAKVILIVRSFLFGLGIATPQVECLIALISELDWRSYSNSSRNQPSIVPTPHFKLDSDVDDCYAVDNWHDIAPEETAQHCFLDEDGDTLHATAPKRTTRTRWQPSLRNHSDDSESSIPTDEETQNRPVKPSTALTNRNAPLGFCY